MVELRQNTPGVLDDRLLVALRHELAHQLLWWACPAASEDRLFHEAFALEVSGELPEWRDAPYQSLSAAASVLGHSPSVDTPKARRALARILGEDRGFPRGALSPVAPVPGRGAMGGAGLSIDELADVAVRVATEATVVLSRHSGEVLLSEGDVQLAVPYGSTLKPFVLAGSPAPPPLLTPRSGVQEWACGQGLPTQVDGRTALLRSCNGYFLDWEAKGGAAPDFGPWGAVLTAVGLTGKPADMADAIGLRSTLALSPWGMAQAYRLLAEARPELIELMKDNAARGTLSELPASPAYAGVATKTGTVRDAASRPQYGWIVAVDADLVAVAMRPGKMPRSFADEVPKVLARVRQRPGLEAARVQVLGLASPSDVEAACRGVGFAIDQGSAAPGAPGLLTAEGHGGARPRALPGQSVARARARAALGRARLRGDLHVVLAAAVPATAWACPSPSASAARDGARTSSSAPRACSTRRAWWLPEDASLEG